MKLYVTRVYLYEDQLTLAFEKTRYISLYIVVKELRNLAQKLRFFPSNSSKDLTHLYYGLNTATPDRFTFNICLPWLRGPDWARTSDPALIKRML